MRVVLDTNVVVSGTISAHSVPGEIINAWRRKRFDLLVTPVLLQEYRRALGYERVRHFHRLSDREVDLVVRRFALDFAFDPPLNIRNRCRR